MANSAKVLTIPINTNQNVEAVKEWQEVTAWVLAGSINVGFGGDAQQSVPMPAGPVKFFLEPGQKIHFHGMGAPLNTVAVTSTSVPVTLISTDANLKIALAALASTLQKAR